MATYVIGDVQGCWQALQRLLNKVNFDVDEDELWFCGDLINRGPQSLEVLRFVYTLQNAVVVLGNHDLHFLAVYFKQKAINEKDTFSDLLDSDFAPVLAQWLCKQPLIHHDEALDAVMVHAGIPPTWSLNQAKALAAEVESLLQSPKRDDFFQHMYANEPMRWSDDLRGWDRYRMITNYFTRMRLLDASGNLALQYKGELASAPAELTPWFAVPRTEPITPTLLFGHWAALEGKCNADNVEALDGGCIWGNELIAMRLEDRQRFSVPA